jgi:hypothetical protein
MYRLANTTEENMGYKTDEFLLAEYQALRDEIITLIKEMRLLARYSVIASGGLWAWLLTNGTAKPYYHMLAYLPALITLVLSIYGPVTASQINMAGRYIARIEKLFNLPEGMGWETQRGIARKYRFTRFLEVLFWLTLLAANVFAAVFINP